MSEVVRTFLETPTPDRHVTQMTIDDAPHYTPEERARIVNPLVLSRMDRRIADRTNLNRLAHYRPYPKQAAFHAAGDGHRERLFMAGNQLGKTLAGSIEEAVHATGRYPAWWRGRRFDRPTVSWVAGVTAESTRDNVQRLLLGRPGAWGTGSLPQDAILETSAARGV